MPYDEGGAVQLFVNVIRNCEKPARADSEGNGGGDDAYNDVFHGGFFSRGRWGGLYARPVRLVLKCHKFQASAVNV